MERDGVLLDILGLGNQPKNFVFVLHFTSPFRRDPGFGFSPGARTVPARYALSSGPYARLPTVRVPAVSPVQRLEPAPWPFPEKSTILWSAPSSSPRRTVPFRRW